MGREMDLQWEDIADHPLEQGMAFEEFVAKYSPVQAFVENDRIIRCIDEGTPGGEHLAGSGILYEDEDALVQLIKRNGIRGLMSHEGCGAAGLYARRHNLPEESADLHGARRIRELAWKAGIEYSGHIERAQMVRPAGRHTAWAVYYDGTGQFDPTKVALMPPGFVISRSLHLVKDIPLMEAEIAISIATSPHGWGNRFKEEGKQLLLVPIGSRDLSVEQLVEELRPIQERYRDLVRIDGFNAAAYTRELALEETH